jgi:signal transduction histidine kinase
MMPRTLNAARWPVRWQIVGVLLLTQLLAHAFTIIVVTSLWNGPGRHADVVASEMMSPFATTLRILDGVDPPTAIQIVAAIEAADGRFRTTYSRDGATSEDTASEVTGALRALLPVSLAEKVEVRPADKSLVARFANGRVYFASYDLGDGRTLVFESQRENILQFVPRVFAILTVMVLSVPVMLLMVWAGTVLVSPLAALAAGAERFSRNLAAPPVDERGPAEVRVVARTMNRMRERIQKLVTDRSQALAAIGHDMRTPLTRLRLRVESSSDLNQKHSMLADVLTLEIMINSTLKFLRGQQKKTAWENIDVAVLVQTILSEFEDAGCRVSYSGPLRLAATCDRDLLKRAVCNIVDNALKYAGSARVDLLSLDPETFEILVSDHGPGIAADQREAVLQPFYRADAARSLEGGDGFGMGLAIVKEVVDRHSGSIELTDNYPGGLVVTLRLPRHQIAEHPAPEALPDRQGAMV